MIQATKIIGTGLATTGLIGAGLGLGLGLVNVFCSLIVSIIAFNLLFIGYFIITNTDLNSPVLLIKASLYNLITSGFNCINIIWVPVVVIVIVLFYSYFIGFSILELASDVSPSSIQGLRVSIAILQARKVQLESEIFQEGANLRALIASGTTNRINLTRLANLGSEEQSVMSEIARLTTALNNATASLPE